MIDLLPLLDDSRTEEPTQRRLRRAATAGEQAEASNLAHPLAFLAALLAMRAAGPAAFDELLNAANNGLSAAAEGGLPQLETFVSPVGRLLVPAALAGFAASATVRLALGSRLFAAARLAPRLDRLGQLPWTRLALPNLAANTAWIAAKLATVAALVWAAFPAITPAQELAGVLTGALRLALWLTVTWLAFGTAEHLLARASFAASLRMTRVEVKDDFKLAEGDPHVHGQILEAIERRAAASPGARARTKLRTSNSIVNSTPGSAIGAPRT